MITDNGVTPIDILIVLVGLALFLYLILRVMLAVILGAKDAWRMVHYPPAEESKIHE